VRIDYAFTEVDGLDASDPEIFSIRLGEAAKQTLIFGWVGNVGS
jgi:hypothetical protein